MRRRRRGSCIGTAAIGLLLGSMPLAGYAAEAPANTLHDLFAHLDRCMSGVRVPAPAGTQITFRFSLRRDGSLIGRPKITFAALPKDKAQSEAFVAAVAGSFAKCLPVPVTAGLGGAVAGRPVSFRLVVKAPSIGA